VLYPPGTLDYEGDPALWHLARVVTTPGVRYRRDGSGEPDTSELVSIEDGWRDLDNALLALGHAWVKDSIAFARQESSFIREGEYDYFHDSADAKTYRSPYD
jgi:hypothetical protein